MMVKTTMVIPAWLSISQTSDKADYSEASSNLQALALDNDVQDSNEVICNKLIDTDINLFNETLDPKSAKTLLKSLQLFREMPSKDCRKRFAAGSIYGDEDIPDGHDVLEFEFWAISTVKLRRICCFLVGQIIIMSHLGKTCTSEMKTNHNLEVMLEIYEYDPIEQLYKMQGRTGLLRAYNSKINEEITLHNELKAISFDHTKVAGLKGYVPFYAQKQ